MGAVPLKNNNMLENRAVRCPVAGCWQPAVLACLLKVHSWQGLLLRQLTALLTGRAAGSTPPGLVEKGFSIDAQGRLRLCAQESRVDKKPRRYLCEGRSCGLRKGTKLPTRLTTQNTGTVRC